MKNRKILVHLEIRKQIVKDLNIGMATVRDSLTYSPLREIWLADSSTAKEIRRKAIELQTELLEENKKLANGLVR